MISEMPAELFDWQCWRNGSPTDLLLVCREEVLLANKKTLQDHAVGWCMGDAPICRPKNNCKAVMFFKDGEHFWFHLMNKEFDAIFK